MSGIFSTGPCCDCGVDTASVHIVQLYVLPAKLRRAKHKRVDQAAPYCCDCWEATSTLKIFVGGRELLVDKKPQPIDDVFLCQLCGIPILHGELHSLLAYSIFVGDSITESFPLAMFCGGCVESEDIRLRSTSAPADR